MCDMMKLGLAGARDALRKGEVTSVALTEGSLTAIERAGALNAFAHVTADIAMDRAKAADARLASGDAPAMCGLPIGMKDLFCTKGAPSQAASNILKGFVPEYESTVSQNLIDDGAVMVGKLNMDEFAMGSSNETSAYGNVISPWRAKGSATDLTPGGSSGGSAAAGGGGFMFGGNGDGYGRVHPPTRRLYGHCRDKAHLWPLFALGDCRLCLVP